MRTLLTLALLALTVSVPAHAETAYERVVKTNTLRCGYILWPTSIDKDPNTGAFSGMNYEFVEAMGKKLDLKIDWAMEVISGQQVEALRTGKIDAVCASEGPLVLSTAKQLAYTDAIMWSPFFAHVRSDDRRFDKAEDILNSPDVTFSAIEGDNTQAMAHSKFPNAKILALPSSGDASQMMLNVTTGKADVVILDAPTLAEFAKNNPRKLRRVSGVAPVGYIPNTLSVLNSETQLLNLLNIGVLGVHSYGDAETIFKKYEARYPGAKLYYRPALPFVQ